LLLDAYHSRTGADHVEFDRRSTAQIDDPATTIGAAISDPYDNTFSIAVVCDSDARTER
jgi:hypothetical protein